MGLDWSQPRSNKGKSIVRSAAFPANSTVKARLWNLWRDNKEGLKADGFSVGKYQEEWQVSHWHDILPNSESYKKIKTPRGVVEFFQADFEIKYKKWYSKFNQPSLSVSSSSNSRSSNSTSSSNWTRREHIPRPIQERPGLVNALNNASTGAEEPHFHNNTSACPFDFDDDEDNDDTPLETGDIDDDFDFFD